MLTNRRVAVLDDDADDCAAVLATLESAGAVAMGFARAADLLKALRTESFDALVIDWNLPDMSGVEAVTKVRRELLLDVPVVLLTSRSEDHEVTAALYAGADDFVIKPAARDILLARIAAVIRRQAKLVVSEGIETFGEFAFDIANRTVTRGGVPLLVTDREFKLALILFRNLGRAQSRDHLMQSVWGHVASVESRTLDVHVSRVRAKFSLSPQHGWRLATVYGYGYRLEAMREDGGAAAA